MAAGVVGVHAAGGDWLGMVELSPSQQLQAASSRLNS